MRAATCPVTPIRALGGKIPPLEQSGRLGLLLVCPSLGGPGHRRPLPTPEDSPIGSVDNAEVVLDGRVMSTVRCGTHLSVLYCELLGGTSYFRYVERN